MDANKCNTILTENLFQNVQDFRFVQKSHLKVVVHFFPPFTWAKIEMFLQKILGKLPKNLGGD